MNSTIVNKPDRNIHELQLWVFMALSRLTKTADECEPMKYFLLPGLFILLLGGCGTNAKTLDPYIQKLQWLDAANPQDDARQAIKKGDLRLLGLATRAINIPGVKKEDSYKYEKACGVQLIDGISDVVRSDEHLRLMQKARSYALKYNAIIKTQCKP